MNVPSRLAAFAGALAVVFAGAYGVGAVADPVSDPAPSAHAGDAHGAMSAVAVPAGLAVSDRGYTLHLRTPQLAAGTPTTLSFDVTGPDGSPVVDYRVGHEKELHLVVVRRDLSSYQHLHPSRDAAGTWSTPITLAEPGTYRVFADFEPAALDGEGVTLGTDLLVPGGVVPWKNALTRTAVVDGYEVTLAGDPVAGEETELRLTVRRDGEPVTDLEPYLGARGHLISLRVGDLAYLHSHPIDGAEDDATIRFATTFPTAGGYALYLDFSHGGVVRTAQFLIDVPRHES